MESLTLRDPSCLAGLWGLAHDLVGARLVLVLRGRLVWGLVLVFGAHPGPTTFVVGVMRGHRGWCLGPSLVDSRGFVSPGFGCMGFSVREFCLSWVCVLRGFHGLVSWAALVWRDSCRSGTSLAGSCACWGCASWCCGPVCAGFPGTCSPWPRIRVARVLRGLEWGGCVGANW